MPDGYAEQAAHILNQANIVTSNGDHLRFEGRGNVLTRKGETTSEETPSMASQLMKLVEFALLAHAAGRVFSVGRALVARVASNPITLRQGLSGVLKTIKQVQLDSMDPISQTKLFAAYNGVEAFTPITRDGQFDTNDPDVVAQRYQQDQLTQMNMRVPQLRKFNIPGSVVQMMTMPIPPEGLHFTGKKGSVSTAVARGLGSAAGSAIGAAIGTAVIPVIGTIIGGIIGGGFASLFGKEKKFVPSVELTFWGNAIGQSYDGTLSYIDGYMVDTLIVPAIDRLNDALVKRSDPTRAVYELISRLKFICFLTGYDLSDALEKLISYAPKLQQAWQNNQGVYTMYSQTGVGHRPVAFDIGDVVYIAQDGSTIHAYVQTDALTLNVDPFYKIVEKFGPMTDATRDNMFRFLLKRNHDPYSMPDAFTADVNAYLKVGKPVAFSSKIYEDPLTGMRSTPNMTLRGGASRPTDAPWHFDPRYRAQKLLSFIDRTTFELEQYYNDMKAGTVTPQTVQPVTTTQMGGQVTSIVPTVDLGVVNTTITAPSTTVSPTNASAPPPEAVDISSLWNNQMSYGSYYNPYEWTPASDIPRTTQSPAAVPTYTSQQVDALSQLLMALMNRSGQSYGGTAEEAGGNAYETSGAPYGSEVPFEPELPSFFYDTTRQGCVCDACVTAHDSYSLFTTPDNESPSNEARQVYKSGTIDVRLATIPGKTFARTFINTRPFVIEISKDVVPSRQESALSHELIHVLSAEYKLPLDHQQIHALGVLVNNELVPALKALREQRQ